jgi:glutamine cyclotransferase
MRWLKGFALPDLTQPEVHLTPEDVLFEMTYNEVGIGQGGFIKDGKVYFSAGSPPFHCKLHVYDLKTKEEVLCQELLPLRYEPEGIEIVGDKLYTVFWCSGGVTKIYEFALPIL